MFDRLIAMFDRMFDRMFAVFGRKLAASWPLVSAFVAAEEVRAAAARSCCSSG